MKKLRRFDPEQEGMRVGDVWIDARSRDDIPKLLGGLRDVYLNVELREAVFRLLEERIGGDGNRDAVGPGAVTITLLTRAGFCGMHDACRLACDSFARKRFRGLRARSGREARAGARLRASCALARSGATRGASRAFRRRGRSCRGWRRSWG